MTNDLHRITQLKRFNLNLLRASGLRDRSSSRFGIAGLSAGRTIDLRVKTGLMLSTANLGDVSTAGE
jgi:hypothetical protein